MKGEKHENKVGNVGEQNGCRIEDQCSLEDVKSNGPGEILPVFHHESDTCYHIDAVCQQQVDQHGQQRCYVGMEYLLVHGVVLFMFLIASVAACNTI